MSRRIKDWAACGLVLAAAIAAPSLQADELPPAEAKVARPGQSSPATAPADVRRKRGVLNVRNGSAKDLAGALQIHFRGEAEIQAAPEPANNTLLVAASPAVFDEVVETLSQLDRPSKKIVVDVLLIDVLSPRDAGAVKEAGDGEVDEHEFTGPVERVLARLETLSRQKRITNVRQMRIETLENQSGQFQAGEEKPRVNGFAFSGATGLARPTVQQRAVGTIVTVTPHLVGAGKVQLDLLFRDDHLQTPEDAIEIAKGENGPVISPDVVTLNLQSRVTVSAGQAAIVGRTQTSAVQKQTRTHIVVAARVAEETPPATK